MYDYTAADADEVSFKDGDTIVNVQAIDEGWMYGTVQRTGKTGMLPANYVEAVWAREQPSPGTAASLPLPATELSNTQALPSLPWWVVVLYKPTWAEKKRKYITKYSCNFFPSKYFWKLPANTTRCCSWELLCFWCPKPFWNCLRSLCLKHLSIQYHQNVLNNTKNHNTVQYHWAFVPVLETMTSDLSLFILPYGENLCGLFWSI